MGTGQHNDSWKRNWERGQGILTYGVGWPLEHRVHQSKPATPRLVTRQSRKKKKKKKKKRI